MARPLPSSSDAHRAGCLACLFCLLLPASGTAAVKKMFVTSVSGSTKLSTWLQAQGQTGLAAGDAICQTLAHDGAGLRAWQDFRAWISSPTEDAYCRVAGFDGLKVDDCGELGLPDAGPWERMDGKPFAFSLSELTDGNALLHPPRIDEMGNTVPSGSVLTGTAPDGEVWTDGHCSGWTSDAGGSVRIGGQHLGGHWWTSNGTAGCGWMGRLYCFESGSGDSLPPFEAPGKLFFLTSVLGTGDLGTWADAGLATGLAAGDAICRARATVASLPSPESFFAWLSDEDVDAIDRVTTDGPFKRPDGVQIAASKADLVDATVGNYQIATAIAVTELGAYVGGFTWTGSGSTGEVLPENCDNWTSADIVDDGWRGYTQETRGFWTTGAAVACSIPQHLYCFSNLGTIFADGFESDDTSSWSASVP